MAKRATSPPRARADSRLEEGGRSGLKSGHWKRGTTIFSVCLLMLQQTTSKKHIVRIFPDIFQSIYLVTQYISMFQVGLRLSIIQTKIQTILTLKNGSKILLLRTRLCLTMRCGRSTMSLGRKKAHPKAALLIRRRYLGQYSVANVSRRLLGTSVWRGI